LKINKMKFTILLVAVLATALVQGRPSPHAEPETSGIIRGNPDMSEIIRHNDPEQIEIIRSEREEPESPIEADKEVRRERRNDDDLLTQSIIRGHLIIRDSPIIRKDSIIRNGK
jgi:hypothetical protein